MTPLRQLNSTDLLRKYPSLYSEYSNTSSSSSSGSIDSAGDDLGLFLFSTPQNASGSRSRPSSRHFSLQSRLSSHSTRQAWHVCEALSKSCGDKYERTWRASSLGSSEIKSR